MTTDRPDPDLEPLYADNRRHWDELAAIHLAPGGYNLGRLDAAAPALDPIVDAGLAAAVGDLDGKRIIHLQCHIGLDSLILAKRGAQVTGVDFSAASLVAARDLSARHGLTDRTRFVECNLYDAPAAAGGAGAFDLAFITWGAIGWLPDIRAWARVVAHFLAPDGAVFLAEGHPAAFVFDDLTRDGGPMPGWFAPYFNSEPLSLDEVDYANAEAPVENQRVHAWMHPLGAVVMALIDAGLTIRALHEHDSVAWRMFADLTCDAHGMWRWPDRAWLPLSYSLIAERPR